MAKHSINANISVTETKQRERQNRDKQQKKRGGEQLRIRLLASRSLLSNFSWV